MKSSPTRQAAWRFAEIFGLCGLAVAQPAFDYIAGSTRWIVAIQATWVNVMTFTLIALLAPPFVVFLLESLMLRALPHRYASALHAAIVGALAGVLVNGWLKPTSLPVRYRLLMSGASVALVAVTRVRWAAMRMWMRVLAIAPIVYALTFVAAPGTAELASAANGQAAAPPLKAHVPRVVFVSFDELPLMSLLDGDGNIDSSLFPGFADLAAHATWYRNSATNADHTLRAFPAMWSGQFPSERKVPAPTAKNFPITAFSMLGNSYLMNVHEAHEVLCPRSACAARNPFTSVSGLRALITIGSRAARAKVTPVSDDGPTIADVVAPNSLERADEFVASLRRSSRPVFDYAHIMMPHQPWSFVGPARTETRRIEPVYGTWPSADSALMARQKHLLTLEAADATLQRVISRLKTINAYDEALIIVTADHGISFLPGQPDRTATKDNYPGIVWTPLFIKEPHQTTGAMTDTPVQTIDLLPTILDYVGVTPPMNLPGTSVRNVAAHNVSTFIRVATTDEGGPKTTLAVDRARGFAEVLTSRAWPGRTGDSRRLFRIGPFGDVVGTVPEARSLVLDATIPTKVLTGIRPDAKMQPWISVQGQPSDPTATTVAVTVNGRVAGIGIVEVAPRSGRPSVDIMLDPSAFTPGPNELKLFSITGSPNKPAFTQIVVAE